MGDYHAEDKGIRQKWLGNQEERQKFYVVGEWKNEKLTSTFFHFLWSLESSVYW